MSRYTYVAPVAMLVTCAGLCGGADLAARSSARSSANQELLAEPPPTPIAPSPTPRSARPSSKRTEYPPGTPAGALSFVVDVAKDAASLYGYCRNEGTWLFTVTRAQAIQTLADPTVTEERRAAAQQTLDMHDGTLNADGPIGDVFRVCGIIGPSEPPPWLATVPLPPGGPRPSPPPDEDATGGDTALTDDKPARTEIVVVEPSVPPR